MLQVVRTTSTRVDMVLGKMRLFVFLDSYPLRFF
jgi:hypothetical protein